MLIKMYVLTFVISFGLFGQAFSQETGAQQQTKSLQEVQNQVKIIISDQIEAFGSFDIERAYFHASPSIKSIFPDSKIFGEMVKRSYPMIWNPKSYEFISTSSGSSGILQRVMFKDQKDTMHFFDYVLENNGSRWVISGVYMVQGEKGV